MADFIFTEDDLEPAEDELLDDEPNQPRSYVAPDMVMDGKLKLKHGIEIAGLYKGGIHSNSTIKILPPGRIEGNVDTFNLSIEGSANLSLIARKRLEINKGGFFVGVLEVQPEIIVLSEFATFGQDEKNARAFHDEFTREMKDSQKASPQPETKPKP
jgi:cytoskeletal protein CcmA (bactofilin family)